VRRYLAVAAACFAAVTCNLVEGVKTGAPITVNYMGRDSVAVGTKVIFQTDVRRGTDILAGARIHLTSSSDSIISVRDDTLFVNRRGVDTVIGTLLGSNLGDKPPSDTVVFHTLAAAVQLDSTSVTLRSINDSVQLHAQILGVGTTLIPGDTIADSLVSSDTMVVKVAKLVNRGGGLLIARSTGNATLTAWSDTARVQIPVHVIQALKRYGFSPSGPQITALNVDSTVAVAPQDARGNPIPTSAPGLTTPSYSSDDAGVFTVTGSGTYTARLRSVGTGTANLRVQAGTVDTSIVVRVTQAATALHIVRASATDTITAINDTLTLLATATDANNVAIQGQQVSWTPVDPTVVRVDPIVGSFITALVHGSKVGVTQIAARLNGATDTIGIVVLNLPRTLKVTHTVLLTTIGDSATLADTVFNRIGNPILTGIPVAFRALDTTIATVNPNLGIVVAKAAGTTKVVGSFSVTVGPNNLSAVDTATITVENRIAAVKITSPDTSLQSLGDTVTVRTAFTNSRGAPVGNSAAGWSSSDSSVATVTNGFVTARAAGLAAIYAFDRLNVARFDSVRVTVTNAPASVSLNRHLDTLTSSSLTLQYVAAVRNARGALITNPTLTWLTDNSTVASVIGSGLATALAPGTARIISQAGTNPVHADTATLVVRNDAVSLTVSPTSVTISSVGDSTALGAAASNAVGGAVTGVSFLWSSNDITVAKVSSSGEVTGVGVGTATVTAQLAALSASATVTVTNAPATVDITSPDTTLASVGDAFSPAVTLKNAVGAALPRTAAQWLSDVPAVASVTPDGTVIAVARGVTKVRARNAQNTARQDSVTVTVTNAPDSIKVNPVSITLPSLNRTTTFTATVFNKRRAVISDAVVTWLSINPSIANVSATGTATSFGIGSTKIVGTAGAVSDTGLVQVSNLAATVQVSPTSATITSVVATAGITATARNELGVVIATPTVAWASTNTAVATVSVTGVVTSVATGTTTVTATVDGVTASAAITVRNDPTTIVLATHSVPLGNLFRTDTPAFTTFTNAQGGSLTATRNAALWTTDNASVVTVTANGLVTAVGAGTTKVRATSPSSSAVTDSVSYTVNDPPNSLAVNRHTDTLTALGRTAQFSAQARDSAGNVLGAEPVAWTSENAGVVSVSSNGVATAVAVGGPIRMIASTSNAHKDTVQVTVTNAPASVALAPTGVTLTSVLDSVLVRDTVRNNVGNAISGSAISWTTSNVAIVGFLTTTGGSTLSSATTTDTVRLKAAGTGTATITATTSSGLTTTLTVTVRNDPTTILFTTHSVPLANLFRTDLPAFTTFANALGATLGTRSSATWTTDNASVVTVTSAGLVTAVGAGSTKVRATSPGNSAVTDSVSYTVLDPPNSLALNRHTDTLTALGRTAQFTAQVRDSAGNVLGSEPVTWTSENTAVVTVSTNGVATAVALGGPINVIASTSNAHKDTVQVTVTNAPASVALAPSSVTLTSVPDSVLVRDTVRNNLGNAISSSSVAWTTSNVGIVGFLTTTGGGTLSSATTTDTVRLKSAGTGTATITATTANGIATTLTVTVRNDPATIAFTTHSVPLGNLFQTDTPAFATFTNARGASLTATRNAALWTTDNASVATVTSGGVVTAVGAGTTRVHATSPGNSAVADSITYTVTDPPASLTLNRDTDTLTALGRTAQYTAQVRDSAGNVLGAEPVTWTSATPGVVTVSTNGVATAVTVGGPVGVIAAASNGKADTVQVTVTNAPASVALAPNSVTLTSVLDSVLVRDTVRNNVGNPITGSAISWTTSNVGIVGFLTTTSGSTLSSATTTDTVRLKSAGVGAATVTATTANGIATTFSVTVRNDVTQLDITPTSATVRLGQTYLPAVTFQNALNVTLGRGAVTWSSSDPSVVTANDTGLVSTLRGGVAYVRAVSPVNSTVRDSVQVTVNAPPKTIVLNRATDTLTALGRTDQFTATVKDTLGNVLNLTLTWSSSAPGTVSVNASGLATGVIAGGPVYIRAKAGTAPDTVIDSVRVTVTNAPASVALAPSAVTITSVNDTSTVVRDTVRNNVGNAIAASSISWTTSDPTIVKFYSGGNATNSLTTVDTVRLKAIGTGAATVTATTSNGIATTLAVTVRNDPTTILFTTHSVTLGNLLRADTAAFTTFTNALGATLPRTAALWTTTNASVVTVTAGGVVTAVGAGTAKVRATSPGNSAVADSVSYTVTDPPASLALNRHTDTLTALGRTAQFTAQVRDSAGNVLGAEPVTWTSENPGVVTVSANGLATAVAVGGPIRVIAATTSNGKADTVLVTVTNAPASVALAPSAVTITSVNDTSTVVRDTVRNNVGNAIAASSISWTTSDPTIVKFYSGGNATNSLTTVDTVRLKAIGTGAATVTATTSNGIATTLAVTVRNDPTTILFTTHSVTLGNLLRADTAAFTTFTNALGATLPRTAALWTTTNASVVTVTAGGVVTAVGAGTAKVRATSPGNSAVADSVSYTVTDPAASIVLDRSTDSLTAFGQTRAYTATVRDSAGNVLSASAVSINWSATNNAGPRVTFTPTTGAVTTATATTATGGTPVTLTATATPTLGGPLTASVTIGVGNDPASILATPTAVTFSAVGDSTKVTASVLNALGTAILGSTHTWSTSNAGVVTFLPSGSGPADANPSVARDTMRLKATGAGSATVTVQVGTVSTTLLVTVAHIASAATSTISASPTSIVANGSSTSTITVQLKDAQGNNVTAGGDAVVLNTSAGSLSAVIDNHTGTYTSTLTSSANTADTAFITGTVNTVAFAHRDTVTFTPGPATHLTFTVQPTTTTAGQAITPAVKVAVKDANGNTVTTDQTTTITLAIGANPGSGTLSGTFTNVQVSNGVASFANLSINKTGTGYTLTAASTPLYTGATSSTFNITPAAPDHLGFLQQPTTTVATQTITPAVTVAVQDAFNNTVTTDQTTTITLAIGTNPSSGMLAGTFANVQVSNGVASFANLSINKVGTGYTLTAASSPSYTGATSSTFDITLDAATKLAFLQQPTTTVAGVSISPAVTVAVQDAGGNTVTTDQTTTITLAIGANPGSGTLSGTFTNVQVSNGVASFANLSINKTGTGYTLTAASTPPYTGATSSTFDITPAAPDHLGFLQQPTTTAATQTITPAVTVAVQDAFNNTITTDNATTITLAIGTNPSSGTLAGTFASVQVSNGVASFANLSINKVGTGYTLTAASSPSYTGATSSTFDITLDAATKLAFLQQPTTTVAGVSISPAVTVAVQDAGGNTVTTDQTTTITLAIGANPGSGTLSGTFTNVQVSNGVASFADLSIDKTGTGYTLTANSGVLTQAISSAFDITPGAPDHLFISTQPSSTASVGVPFLQQPVIQVRDAFDNIVTTDNATQITVALHIGAAGNLTGTLTVTVVNGVATFTNLQHDTVETIQLDFTSSPATTTVTSTTIMVS
jgi:uncharacterized protein YjdB